MKNKKCNPRVESLKALFGINKEMIETTRRYREIYSYNLKEELIQKYYPVFFIKTRGENHQKPLERILSNFASEKKLETCETTGHTKVGICWFYHGSLLKGNKTLAELIHIRNVPDNIFYDIIKVWERDPDLKVEHEHGTMVRYIEYNQLGKIIDDRTLTGIRLAMKETLLNYLEKELRI